MWALRRLCILSRRLDRVRSCRSEPRQTSGDTSPDRDILADKTTTNKPKCEDTMKTILLFCIFAFALLVATAQDTAPEGFQQWTGASLTQLEQTLKGGSREQSAPHFGAPSCGFSQ